MAGNSLQGNVPALVHNDVLCKGKYYIQVKNIMNHPWALFYATVCGKKTKKTSVLHILSASCLCSVKKEIDTNNYWFQNSWNTSKSLSWCSRVKRDNMLKWWIHQWALLVNIPLKVSFFGGLTAGVFRIALAFTALLTLSFLPYPLSACQRWEGFLYRPQF